MFYLIRGMKILSTHETRADVEEAANMERDPDSLAVIVGDEIQLERRLALASDPRQPAPTSDQPAKPARKAKPAAEKRPRAATEIPQEYLAAVLSALTVEPQSWPAVAAKINGVSGRAAERARDHLVEHGKVTRSGNKRSTAYALAVVSPAA
jgi:hypothetical protein